MTEVHLDLEETTVDGTASRLWSLTCEECPELAVHRIKRLGVTDAAVAYRRVRVRPTGSFVMVCHEGRGQVLLDGRWQSSRRGVACLAPPQAAPVQVRRLALEMQPQQPASGHPNSFLREHSNRQQFQSAAQPRYQARATFS